MNFRWLQKSGPMAIEEFANFGSWPAGELIGLKIGLKLAGSSYGSAGD